MRRRAAAFVALLAVAASTLVGVAPAHADYIQDAEYWLDQYGIREAWQTTRGDGVTIAVIDTGVDGSHPSLQGAIVGGTDFSGLGSSNGQQPVGSTGSDHGTMVASLAAGRGSAPGEGMIGSAPEASLLTISIGFGEGTLDSDTEVANAVRWAVDNGAEVINMSLTRNTLSWPESWDDAFLYAMQRDVVIVAAAGNRGSGTTTVGAPATMPGVLTVAGVDRNGEASRAASSQGITIGVSAPSEQLIGAVPGGGFVQWDGTSGATPIVAGIVALVRSAYPELDAANVINRVVSTARAAGANGADPIYGFGLVDAAAAVTAEVAPVSANPMGSLSEWIRVNRRAEPTSTPTVPAVPPVLPGSPAGPPVAGGVDNPLGTLYPSIMELRNVGVPLAVLFVFGALFLGMTVMAIRQFGRLSRRG